MSRVCFTLDVTEIALARQRRRPDTVLCVRPCGTTFCRPDRGAGGPGDDWERIGELEDEALEVIAGRLDGRAAPGRFRVLVGLHAVPLVVGLRDLVTARPACPVPILVAPEFSFEEIPGGGALFAVPPPHFPASRGGWHPYTAGDDATYRLALHRWGLQGLPDAPKEPHTAVIAAAWEAHPARWALEFIATLDPAAAQGVTGYALDPRWFTNARVGDERQTVRRYWHAFLGLRAGPGADWHPPTLRRLQPARDEAAATRGTGSGGDGTRRPAGTAPEAADAADDGAFADFVYDAWTAGLVGQDYFCSAAHFRDDEAAVFRA